MSPALARHAQPLPHLSPLPWFPDGGFQGPADLQGGMEADAPAVPQAWGRALLTPFSSAPAHLTWLHGDPAERAGHPMRKIC